MSESASPAAASAARLWLWPVVLGVLTASGLLSALVSDGWGDAWSWLALGIPVAVMGWFACVRHTASPIASPSSHLSSNEPSP